MNIYNELYNGYQITLEKAKVDNIYEVLMRGKTGKLLDLRPSLSKDEALNYVAEIPVNMPKTYLKAAFIYIVREDTLMYLSPNGNYYHNPNPTIFAKCNWTHFVCEGDIRVAAWKAGKSKSTN